MLQYVGCSAMLALIAFFIGLGAAMSVPDLDWSARLIIAAIPAFCTFLASLLLMIRDAMRHAAAMRAARNHLLTGIPTTADEFLAARPTEHPELLLEIRKAIGQFFDVPADRVHRDVNLREDLRADVLAPAFQLAVLHAVSPPPETDNEEVAYRNTSGETIDELAESLAAVGNGQRTRK